MVNIQIENMNNIIKDCMGAIDIDDKKILEAEVSAETLSKLLFELTRNTSNKLVQVRDYEEIAKKGSFKYAGQRDTMFEEGLMPKDVHEGLKELGMDKHIGPSYLRVKGLLTFEEPRKFFGNQFSLLIKEYLEKNHLEKEDGCIVCIPNMTGGAWIGDETRRNLQEDLDVYPVWPSTPYAREMRKVIEVNKQQEKIEDFVEGPLPSPENTGAIFCFEELRTAAETTRNALQIYERFGYNKENGVRLVAASVFDYEHPVGVERLKRMNVDSLYVVNGKNFFAASNDSKYISDSQYETAIDWLSNPWDFTRRILPDIKKLSVK